MKNDYSEWRIDQIFNGAAPLDLEPERWGYGTLTTAEMMASRSELPPVESREEFGISDRAELDTHSGFNTNDMRAPEKFAPVAIDDVTIASAPAWLIDGLSPARGLTCIVGPPKCGKSFLAADALFAIARGVPFAGRETLAGPVFYATGEGVSGFYRRAIAMRRHYDVEGKAVPFFIVDRVPDLGSEKTDVDRFIVDLEAFLAVRGLPAPRAIALDTLARCMGTGDENTARDMGRLIERCGAIERHFGCAVVLIHHTGKDETRKGRGSNALNGAADVTWEVKKLDGCSRVRIGEMKDGPEGVAWNFRLAPFDLGDTASEIGSESWTCVVETLTHPAEAQPCATKSKRSPMGVEGDLLKVIRQAVDKSGEIGIAGEAAPAPTRAVTRANLKHHCEILAWQTDGPANSQRAMLSKNLSKLRSRGLIEFDKRVVWIVGE